MTTVAVGTGLRFARGRVSKPGARALIAAGSGLAYGLTTGTMRVLSAKHHWSDVMTGAAIGAGIGVLPIVTEAIGRNARPRDEARRVHVGPFPGGGRLSGRF